MNDFLPSSNQSETESTERVVWTTEKVDQLVNALNEGIKIKVALPYYEGDPSWRKGDIVFEYTDFEIEELKKCARDITYFAEHYATVMTDEGLQRIKLRDYQFDMLRHFVNNRFSVTLASRQIGKCLRKDTKMIVKINSLHILNKLNAYFKSNFTYDSEIEIYFFELHNVLFSDTYSFLDKFKFKLYKILTYIS